MAPTGHTLWSPGPAIAPLPNPPFHPTHVMLFPGFARPSAGLSAAARAAFRGAACLLLLATASPSVAQSERVLTGVIRGPGGRPVSGAVVRATGEDGRTATARTDAAGRYRLPLAAGSQRWTVSVDAQGMEPQTEVVARPAGGGGVAHDVELKERVVRLAPLTAQASRPSARAARPSAGERSNNAFATTTERLPVEGGELDNVASLTNGVLATQGDEDGSSGVSIAGQPPSQTGLTLDGASYGASSLPQEAVRGTRVVTSSFDVSRGQYSGGQIAATTRSGGTRWAGAAGAWVRGGALRYGEAPGAGSGRENLFLRLDAGGGGPLVRDRLFGFGALQVTRSDASSALLDTVDAAALRRLGVSPDSARRFGEIAARLGVPPSRTGGAGSEQATAVARLDWRLGQSHDVMARLDWRGTRSGGLGASPLGLAGSGGEQESGDGGGLVQATSAWGEWTHTLRAYAAGGGRSTQPTVDAPAGRVRVVSELEDGTQGVAVLQLGGNPWLSSRVGTRLLELSDDLVHAAASGAHQVKVGALYQEEGVWREGEANEQGTFTFGSLAALEAGRPDAFTRTLKGPRRRAEARYAAGYLGDTWRAGGGLTLTFGARLERSWYPWRAGADPAVRETFGTAPGRLPSELRLSPRVGFTWEIPGLEKFLATVRGGAGEFRGKVPLRSLAGALGETGTTAYELVCVGPATPVPDWAGYASRPESVPTACSGGEPEFAARLPAVTLFSPGFSAPRVWNASLGADWKVHDRYFFNVAGTLVRGAARPLARDLNLGPVHGALVQEGGRPLYVSPALIDPFSGSAAPAGSRLRPGLGVVREVDALGRSWTGQLKAELNMLASRSSVVGIGYTFTRSRDAATGVQAPGGATATTAGDPFRREWAASDLEQRHVLQTVISRRLSRSADLGVVARLASGPPFSPAVDGDVNGDGLLNDRAFVFDPRVTDDPELAAGMERLLDGAPGPVRDCLRRQLGRVAGRNSCRTPWSPSLDLRLNFRPGSASFPRRFQASLIASNAAAGLDYLLHGPDGLRGWGQLPFADRTLLHVRGFDPAAGAFRYAVNPGFGRLVGTRGAGRLAFSLTLQGRIALGPDPAFQPLAGIINGSRQSAFSPEAVRAALETRLPNVPAQALVLNGSRALELTPDQALRLQGAAAGLQARLGPARDSLVALLSAGSARRIVAQGEITTLSTRAQALVGEGVEAVRAVLTPAQWRRLPSSLTQPPRDAPLMPPQRVEFSPGGQ
ncbi:MAG: carboxypeptidase regulatory-like domain-containing protein [Longimicrobiaceae bacterium]